MVDEGAKVVFYDGLLSLPHNNDPIFVPNSEEHKNEKTGLRHSQFDFSSKTINIIGNELWQKINEACQEKVFTKHKLKSPECFEAALEVFVNMKF